jgi:hypothetical protein
LAVPLALDALHRVVVLAALPAEGQREQHTAAVARHVVLPLDGDEAPAFGLQGGVDGVAAADELVDAKGEGELARLGVTAGVAGEQARLQRLDTAFGRRPRPLAQFAGGPALAGEAARFGAHQPAALRLGADAEGALDPDREWVVDKRRVVGRRRPSGEHAVAQGGDEEGVVEPPLRGGPAQGLPDDVFRTHLDAEEQRDDSGHLRLLLLIRPRAGERRGGAHALAAVGGERIAHASHE